MFLSKTCFAVGLFVVCNKRGATSKDGKVWTCSKLAMSGRKLCETHARPKPTPRNPTPSDSIGSRKRPARPAPSNSTVSNKRTRAPVPNKRTRAETSSAPLSTTPAPPANKKSKKEVTKKEPTKKSKQASPKKEATKKASLPPLCEFDDWGGKLTSSSSRQRSGVTAAPSVPQAHLVEPILPVTPTPLPVTPTPSVLPTPRDSALSDNWDAWKTGVDLQLSTLVAAVAELRSVVARVAEPQRVQSHHVPLQSHLQFAHPPPTFTQHINEATWGQLIRNLAPSPQPQYFTLTPSPHPP
jgi:hypothetical protein